MKNNPRILYCRPCELDFLSPYNTVDAIGQECYYTIAALLDSNTLYSTARSNGTRMSHEHALIIQTLARGKMADIALPRQGLKPVGVFYIDPKNREYLVWSNINLSYHRLNYRYMSLRSWPGVFDEVVFDE